MERRREARAWLEGSIPDAVSTAFFGIQFSALVLRCRNRSMELPPKQFFFLTQAGAHCAIGNLCYWHFTASI